MFVFTSDALVTNNITNDNIITNRRTYQGVNKSNLHEENQTEFKTVRSWGVTSTNRKSPLQFEFECGPTSCPLFFFSSLNVPFSKDVILLYLNVFFVVIWRKGYVFVLFLPTLITFVFFPFLNKFFTFFLFLRVYTLWRVASMVVDVRKVLLRYLFLIHHHCYVFFLVWCFKRCIGLLTIFETVRCGSERRMNEWTTRKNIEHERLISAFKLIFFFNRYKRNLLKVFFFSTITLKKKIFFFK